SVDLLALMDVLAVPAICGMGNLSISSNFSYKPVKVEVFAPSRQSAAHARKGWEIHTSLKSQRLPEKYRNATMRTEPALKPVADYRPQFINYPLQWKDIEVTFSDEEFRALWAYRGTLGDTDEELVRTLFF